MASSTLVREPAANRTSLRARWCMGAVLGGYLAVAVVAGAPNSPLTVPLPVGARPPGWATGAARALALDRVGRPDLIVVSLVLVAVIVGAFVGLLAEAWSGRVSLRAVAEGAVAAIAISVAAPLLLSRDVFTYADAGRIVVVHHRDPYEMSLGSFPRDAFVRVTSAQWVAHHTVYGPASTLASAAIARIWGNSPGMVIDAFKALAGIGAAVAALFSWIATRAVRPERAALAVAVVGLNPVVIVQTVGGGHVDAILAGLLVAALAIAVRERPRNSVRAVAVTTILTLACLMKIVLAPVLALWLWRLARTLEHHRRARVAFQHLVVIVGVSAVMLVPFAHGWRTLTPLVSVGGLESWASPAHLVAHTVQAVLQAIGGSSVGRGADLVVVGAFLVAFLALFVRIGRRSQRTADSWGATLLLLALALPFLLPWYACWFLPFVGSMRDEALARIGVAVSLVLAFTLVPADPFRGFTTPGVMVFAHYVAAPVLLVLVALAARLVWRDRYPGSDGAIDAAL